jgi:hypothetical protein
MILANDKGDTPWTSSTPSTLGDFKVGWLSRGVTLCDQWDGAEWVASDGLHGLFDLGDAGQVE